VRNRRLVVGVLVLLAYVTLAMAQPLHYDQTLTVQVRDTAGNPLHACITVISPEHEVTSFCQVDDHGNTTIPNLPAKRYRVSVKSAGYVMQQKEIEVGTGANVVSFTLEAKR
jgi:hypothetical protein